MRDFGVRNAQTYKAHKTGRKCDNIKCKGDLADTIINFGENLNETILNLGYAHGYEADLMLCLGSSMRVTPAAEMAEITATRPVNPGKIVIVNL
jgi:NAD-dependent SIR2 family protein deacetylase